MSRVARAGPGTWRRAIVLAGRALARSAVGGRLRRVTAARRARQAVDAALRRLAPAVVVGPRRRRRCRPDVVVAREEPAQARAVAAEVAGRDRARRRRSRSCSWCSPATGSSPRRCCPRYSLGALEGDQHARAAARGRPRAPVGARRPRTTARRVEPQLAAYRPEHDARRHSGVDPVGRAASELLDGLAVRRPGGDADGARRRRERGAAPGGERSGWAALRPGGAQAGARRARKAVMPSRASSLRRGRRTARRSTRTPRRAAGSGTRREQLLGARQRLRTAEQERIDVGRHHGVERVVLGDGREQAGVEHALGRHPLAGQQQLARVAGVHAAPGTRPR